jgi:hypothetical protein
MRAVKQLIGVFAALIAFWVSNKKRAEESARFRLGFSTNNPQFNWGD